jgi:hypothetical protein
MSAWRIVPDDAGKGWKVMKIFGWILFLVVVNDHGG